MIYLEMERMHKMIKQLNNNEIEGKAHELIAHLEDINPYDASRILNKSMTIVLEVNNKVFRSVKNQSVRSINPDLLQKRHQSIIMSDPEIRLFIHSMEIAPGIGIMDEIRDACVAKFGAKRSPSRSSIGRYLRKKKIEHQQQENK